MLNVTTYSHTITNPRDNFNKDRFLIKDNWFVVADGISSKGAQGAQAAQLACDRVNETNLEEMVSSKDLKSLLLNLCADIRNFNGGTTFTSICIKNDNLILTHVGDSECYLISNNEIKEITIPHTVAYSQYKQGLIKLEDIKTAYYSNVLISYLGSSKLDLNIQIEKFSLKNVSDIVLCSDGANIVPIEKIRELVQNVNISNPAKAIASLAVELGSTDDVTVLVIKFAHVV